jgi:elongation factor 1-gamma
LIAAKYNNLKIEVPPFEFGKSNRTPEFLKKFPLGKVPAFEGKNVNICESNATAFYGRFVYKSDVIDGFKF